VILKRRSGAYNAHMHNLKLVLMLILSAAALEAGAAEPAHGWGLVDWGMTEAQVESAYGDSVEKLPATRKPRADIVESMHLKNTLAINGIAMTQSFAFSQTGKGLERVMLRANLPGAGIAECQRAYQRIRQSEVDRMAAPLEEKPGLRSVHAVWHGAAADAQLLEMEVTGRCFVTLVFKRPSPPTVPSDATADPSAEAHESTAH